MFINNQNRINLQISAFHVSKTCRRGNLSLDVSIVKKFAGFLEKIVFLPIRNGVVYLTCERKRQLYHDTRVEIFQKFLLS